MKPAIENTNLPDDIDLELLKDLEKQNLSGIRKLRKHARFEVSVPVDLLPGNLSAPESDAQTGTSRDVSSGGCLIHFSRPVLVGDVYRVVFRDESLGIPQVYARCVRCIMVRESVFEVGFSFFSPITLESVADDASSGDLID